MKKYPLLSDNYLWTITDSDKDDTETMTITGNENTFYLVKAQYPDDVYDNIIKQAESYRIIKKEMINCTDYRCEESRIPSVEWIVVKDNSFAGIYTLCLHEMEVYLHYVESGHKEYRGLLFIDGTSIGVNYDQFERNPGGWRYEAAYSLVKC